MEVVEYNRYAAIPVDQGVLYIEFTTKSPQHAERESDSPFLPRPASTLADRYGTFSPAATPSPGQLPTATRPDSLEAMKSCRPGPLRSVGRFLVA